jgi:hypothetical protein
LLKLLATVLIAAFGTVASGACAHSPAQRESLTVTAVAEVVPRPVGCGILFVGTPVTFRVVAGPRDLKGKRLDAVVACLDFYPHFYVAGQSYELQLSTQNVYKIEIWPKQAPGSLSFFLKSATDLNTGKTNVFGSDH